MEQGIGMVKYLCETCGQVMAGWACISLEEISGSGNLILYRVPACWDCRKEFISVASQESLFKPIYLDFLKALKRRFREFKEEVSHYPEKPS